MIIVFNIGRRSSAPGYANGFYRWTEELAPIHDDSVEVRAGGVGFGFRSFYVSVGSAVEVSA